MFNYFGIGLSRMVFAFNSFSVSSESDSLDQLLSSSSSFSTIRLLLFVVELSIDDIDSSELDWLDSNTN